MTARKVNPIAEKLLRLIRSEKTIAVPATKVKITKELICFLCDLKYPTLENVFYRTEISYATLKSLKFAGLVTDKEESDYRKWVLENMPKRKKKKIIQVEGIYDEEEARNSFDQFGEQAEGAEESDESEILDTGGAGEPNSFLSED